MSRITVLRLFHRIGRDERVTTHVALTARAFGASGIAISGDRDENLLNSLRGVTERWGGPFEVTHVDDWLRYLKERRSEGDLLVHLTMYGLSLLEVVEELKRLSATRDMVVIVGSSKVPIEVYDLADYNVSIGNQPHSEVAALAVFLDRLLEGRVFSIAFQGAKIVVVPDPKRKRVVRSAWDRELRLRTKGES
ncbi:MAG: tRNA (cytidine(56)-2'-O)-methyltransferase [Nitrososphaerota archaeon]|nr:tRNA (cytidine(56)-2'-O)-methyltransferase [Nitrososphaerota archaeon]